MSLELFKQRYLQMRNELLKSEIGHGWTELLLEHPTASSWLENRCSSEFLFNYAAYVVKNRIPEFELEIGKMRLGRTFTLLS